MQRTAIATIVTLLFCLLLVIVSPHANASVQDVLGDETHAEVTYPPVPWGSGYILPDSPFYKVDNAFQSLRLLLAFTPERRAMVRALIMGERAAEARVMNSRGNTTAMHTALDGLVVQANAAASDLNEAAARGKDVTTLAKSINDMVKFHRDVLKDVAGQSDEAESLRLESLNQELLIAKLHIEDNLKADILASEIESDLDDEIDTRVLGVETQAGKLEDRLNRLDRLASRSADNTIKDDLKAKKDAIKDKRQKMFEELKARKEKLVEERKKRLQEAKDAAKKAREAAQKLRDARRAEKENGASDSASQTEQEHQFPSRNPRGSTNPSGNTQNGSSGGNPGNTNSGSGSSNSGKGSSGSGH